jgi:uncharacterized protein
MKTYRLPFVAFLVLSVVALLGGCAAPAAVSSGRVSGDAALLRSGSGALWVNGQPGEGVIVGGTGTASAEPDLAQVGFGVELRGPNADALVTEAAAKMDAALAAANAFGVVEDKTRTVNYNLWVESVYDPETGRPTGEIIYHLSHQVQVTTDNIGAVGELLSGLVNAGANAVSGVDFIVEDSDALVRQAREAALADARARAEHIAGQLNITLGNPILVTEGGMSAPMGSYNKGLGGAFADEAASPSVTPGSFSVSVNVQIVYAIR